MKRPRVKRGPGPKARLLTQGNYRKKALQFLLDDFQRRCAYCLDPDEFRHPSLNHVDHFDCKIRGRRRNQYANLMLACAACNQSKHDKPVANPLDQEQRLLNCTVENEFPKHISETEDGQWEPHSKEGEYHLAVIGLQERCHRAKRGARRKIAQQILDLCTQAVQYRSLNPEEIQRQILGTVRMLLEHLKAFPPLVTENGVQTVEEWLSAQGVDVRLLVDDRKAGS